MKLINKHQTSKYMKTIRRIRISIVCFMILGTFIPILFFIFRYNLGKSISYFLSVFFMLFFYIFSIYLHYLNKSKYWPYLFLAKKESNHETLTYIGIVVDIDQTVFTIYDFECYTLKLINKDDSIKLYLPIKLYSNKNILLDHKLRIEYLDHLIVGYYSYDY